MDLKRKLTCLQARQDLLDCPIDRLKKVCIDYDNATVLLEHSQKYFSPELSESISKIHTNQDRKIDEIDRDISMYIEIEKEIEAVSREIKLREDAHALLNATLHFGINIDAIMKKVNALAKYPCVYNVRNDVLDVYFASFEFPEEIYNEFNRIIARRSAIVQRFNLNNYNGDMKAIALLKQMQIQYMTDCIQTFNRSTIKDIKWIGVARINFHFFDDETVLQYIFHGATQFNYNISYIFPTILNPQTSESVALADYLKLISSTMQIDQKNKAIILQL